MRFILLLALILVPTYLIAEGIVYLTDWDFWRVLGYLKTAVIGLLLGQVLAERDGSRW